MSPPPKKRGESEREQINESHWSGDPVHGIRKQMCTHLNEQITLQWWTTHDISNISYIQRFLISTQEQLCPFNISTLYTVYRLLICIHIQLLMSNARYIYSHRSSEQEHSFLQVVFIHSSSYGCLNFFSLLLELAQIFQKKKFLRISKTLLKLSFWHLLRAKGSTKHLTESYTLHAYINLSVFPLASTLTLIQVGFQQMTGC